MGQRKSNRLLVTCSHFFKKHFLIFLAFKGKKKNYTGSPGMYPAQACISHFSEELWFLCVANIMRNQDLGIRCAHLLLYFLAFCCTGLPGNTCMYILTCTQIYVHIDVHTYIYIHIIHIYELVSKIINSYFQFQSIPTWFIFAFSHFIFIYPFCLKPGSNKLKTFTQSTIHLRRTRVDLSSTLQKITLNKRIQDLFAVPPSNICQA